MPLFNIQGDSVERVRSEPFERERELQALIEDSLEEIFGVTFIDSEYVTGGEGRIDTLGVDENGSPVIIEYKRGESPNIAAQALFYLNWVLDHQAQIEQDVESVRDPPEVEWDAGVRVILIAEKFDKYTKKAVTQMKPKIRLKRYIRYTNGMLYIQDVTPGRKSIQREMKPSIDEEERVKELQERTSPHTKPIFSKLRKEIKDLGQDITEKLLQNYFAYSIDRNFAELVPQKQEIKVQLDLPISVLEDPKNICEDISDRGSWATGDVRFYVEDENEIDYALNLVKQSYNYFSQ